MPYSFIYCLFIFPVRGILYVRKFKEKSWLGMEDILMKLNFKEGKKKKIKLNEVLDYL